MNRILITIILAILIGAGIVFGLTHNHNNNSNNPPASSTSNNASNNTSSQKQPANQQSSNSNTPTATSSVSIENFAFMPPDITVKKGATVTWTNNDSTTHTVTASTGETGPKSGNLSNGDKYSFTFDQVGTFHYHCSIHPNMLGTVTVTE
jgi:plastocyanin